MITRKPHHYPKHLRAVLAVKGILMHPFTAQYTTDELLITPLLHMFKLNV
jgi:hypothetical protein